MLELTFEWDPCKDQTNREKHRVSFDEAQTVFYDEKARITYDPDHSLREDRFLLLGLSTRFRLLVVSHTYRKNESVIRIISARLATRNEQQDYNHYLR